MVACVLGGTHSPDLPAFVCLKDAGELLMRLVVVALLLVAVSSSPAMAITHFKKIWDEKYTPKGDAPGAGDVDPEFARAARKAGCFICHVKGEKKEEVRNEYGEAMTEFLKAENFDKDRIKNEPEKVKEEILAAFKKVEEKKSKDGEMFGAKLKANKLPASDSGVE